MPARLTRRRFLRRGLTVASALAVPYVPAFALGKGGTTAPSNRICMGFVGLGPGQGQGHLFGGAWTYLPGGYLGRDDVQVLGVCDVIRPRAEEVKQRVLKHYADKTDRGGYACCEAYDDIRALVARADIDAVLIAASYHGAAINSITAVRAGKDVYCEKPTSVSIRASRALVEVAKATGRVYQGGTQQRSEYEGRFRRAVELVRSGRLGRLQRVYSYQGAGGIAPPPSATSGGNVPEFINWEAYVNWLPMFKYRGSTTAHAFGTGEINWGQHHLDIAQWGAGADETGPVEIRLEEDKPIFRFASGVEIYGCPPPDESWGPGGAKFIGTEGSVTVHRNVLVSDPPELLRETPVANDSDVYYSTSHSGNFLECIRTRQKTICDAETAHRAASLLLLGGITKRLGRTLKWDPQREVFPDAPDANRLLTMASRAPWQY